MMRPAPRPVIARTAACVSRSTARTFRSSWRSSASSAPAPNTWYMPNPALLTSTSTGRCASEMRSATAVQPSSVDQVGGQHLDLDAVLARERVCAPRPGGRCRARRGRGRARAASWRANSAPRPAVAPVTRAVGTRLVRVRRDLLALARERASSAPLATASASRAHLGLRLGLARRRVAPGAVGSRGRRVAPRACRPAPPPAAWGPNSEPRPGRGWPRSSGGMFASRQAWKYADDGGRKISTIAAIEATTGDHTGDLARTGKPEVGIDVERQPGEHEDDQQRPPGRTRTAGAAQRPDEQRDDQRSGRPQRRRCRPQAVHESRRRRSSCPACGLGVHLRAVVLAATPS